MNTVFTLRFTRPRWLTRIPRKRLPTASAHLIRLAALGSASLFLLIGAGLAAASTPESVPVQISHVPVDAVFETPEAAAIDALAHALELAKRSADRGRFYIGTIYRTAGGYGYRAPRASRRDVWAGRAPTLRFALHPDDVATYVLHPRSGSNDLDRANERPNASQRRLVDELDPMARPLYVLTPSLRVLRYAEQKLHRVADARPEPPPIEDGVFFASTHDR